MAQSLNKTVLLNTTGTSYLSIAGKVGKFLVGDQALEFYPDVNVEQFIPDSLEPYQPDWGKCHWAKKSVATSKSLQTRGNSIPLLQKTQVPFLKLLAKKLGNIDIGVKFQSLISDKEFPTFPAIERLGGACRIEEHCFVK